MIFIVKFIKYKQGKTVIKFMLVTIIATLAISMCFIRENSAIVVTSKPIALNSNIANNDDIIFNLKVSVDNKVFNIKSSEENIALMLKTQKIILGPIDKVSPSLETKLSTGMNVIITRVKTITITKTIPVDFKTVIKSDISTLKSQSRVLQKGIVGQKSITSNITYINGKEASIKVIKETLIKAPRSKIIVQGTLPIIAFSRGASSKTSKDIITVKATAYWAFKGVNNTYTASGKKAVRNPTGFSTIAVDTRLIPLGTKLYVEGYGYAIAADKGSAVKGKYIDVFFNTRKEAINWGVKYLRILILN